MFQRHIDTCTARVLCSFQLRVNPPCIPCSSEEEIWEQYRHQAFLVHGSSPIQRIQCISGWFCGIPRIDRFPVGIPHRLSDRIADHISLRDNQGIRQTSTSTQKQHRLSIRRATRTILSQSLRISSSFFSPFNGFNLKYV